MGDLINTVKARAAGRLEGSRLSFKDLLLTPEFIFEETSHQGQYSKRSSMHSKDLASSLLTEIVISR